MDFSTYIITTYNYIKLHTNYMLTAYYLHETTYHLYVLGSLSGKF